MGCSMMLKFLSMALSGPRVRTTISRRNATAAPASG
jgi:hypothetical protein